MQKNKLMSYLPYLLESNAHGFLPNVEFKIGVRIRIDGALDSSAKLVSSSSMMSTMKECYYKSLIVETVS